MATQTYYQLLGVAQTASLEEIKKAYRKSSKKYHPDTNPGNKKTEEVFRLISEAYTVLSNTEKRKNYDNLLKKEGKKQKASEKNKTGSKGSFYTTEGFNSKNTAAGFADFFGFVPGQDLSAMGKKKKEHSTNPIDVSDLFNKYMGIHE